jgi:geranylgeranyl diphosphate synthase type II
MKIEDRLSQKKKAVDRELELILPEEDSPLFQAMRYAVLSGGKRFRPLLALSSGECFGVSQNVLLPFACALELIHNYSLIHDDLPSMDNDDFRRGKPSCHKAFGEDIALLAGDALLTLAFEVLVRAPVSADLQSQKEQLIIEIGHLAGVRGMIGGQLMDITLSPEELTEEIMHELILKKTGALILASVKTGALLGKAGKSEFKAIVQYGRNIGLAFQIRDDILDSEGEERKEKNLSPNYVSLFGNEVSEQRLKSFVGIARSVLEETSLECEELHSLASKLLK